MSADSRVSGNFRDFIKKHPELETEILDLWLSCLFAMQVDSEDFDYDIKEYHDLVCVDGR